MDLQLSSLYHFGSGLGIRPSSAARPSMATLRAHAPSPASRLRPARLARLRVAPRSMLRFPRSTTTRAYGYWVLQRDGFRGSDYNRVDARLQKTIKIKERYNAIFGIEAFNLFNHSQLWQLRPHRDHGNRRQCLRSSAGGSIQHVARVLCPQPAVHWTVRVLDRRGRCCCESERH